MDLRQEEGDYARLLLAEAVNIPWMAKLANSIKSNGGITKNNMPFLFELRFAFELHRAGREAFGRGARGLHRTFAGSLDAPRREHRLALAFGERGTSAGADA